jgi:pyruvate kinase
MDEIRLRSAPRAGELSTSKVLYVEELKPHTFLEPGQPILLADGIIMLEARSIEGEEVVCQVIKGGRLRSRVGIAFPDSAIDLRATTSKDLDDVTWGVKHGVDYVAISFVQSADDVHNLREIIKKQGGHTRIIAKIERKKALDHIEDITAAADGIMVARGDLGLEVPLEKLPRLQKNLIDRANAHGIPVIVATQMLASMVTSVRPTRAEVTDVANAVACGADAVMLSDETAIGEHPIASVSYLSTIALEAERSMEFDPDSVQRRSCSINPVPDAIAYAATAAAQKIKASAIIACTETATSARLLSKYRPNQTLFGASPKDTSLRRMALYRGVIPMRVDAVLSHHQEVEGAISAIKEKFQLESGQLAVVISGLSVSQPGSTSLVEIVSIK